MFTIARCTIGSIEETRPTICCWWRWLLIDTIACILLAAKYIDAQLFGLLFKRCISRLLVQHLLFRAIAICRQPCQTFVWAMAHWVSYRKYIVPWQCLSIDRVDSLLWLTISIDRHLFKPAVAATFYLLQYCTGYKDFHTSSIPWLYPSIAQNIKMYCSRQYMYR